MRRSTTLMIISVLIFATTVTSPIWLKDILGTETSVRVAEVGGFVGGGLFGFSLFLRLIGR